MTDTALGRQEVNDLLVETFNSILRVEQDVLNNRLTESLTIAEIHTIHAVGLHDSSPMNVVAARLGVTLATLTASINKLVSKGFVTRSRSQADRRQVLVSLTAPGRSAYRTHELFHKQLVDAALSVLSPEEEAVFARSLVKVKEFFEEQEKRLVTSERIAK
ncbi:MarR family transcriptional regulator [Slackia equolifaciens]|uniref:MarR family transcriptional regulator n=1 Tax=Slackia equolifaciens TaxID=498718 RepID=A0A3N0B455_9ACTN|nr:MarR family winged helix-turn-helix transcriptional regulator [Slackia equolifaciens]RNL41895.1 MarR family transcriptional regulator [Slackia equolifaciens]HJF64870.1 MarR family winged helix-turn-helix transcriptional regulator [Slackia equolifaciens]